MQDTFLSPLRRTPPRQMRRRAMAPLELVMSLPFLLGVFAMLLSIGFVSLEKARVVVAARHDVWTLRQDPSASPAGMQVESDSNPKPFSVTGANHDTSGLVYGKVTGNAKRFAWLGGPVQPQGQAAVLAQSWDSKQVSDFDDQPDGPHLSVLDRMIGGNGAVGALAGGLLGALLGGNLPNQAEIDQAGAEADKAEQRAREERDKLVQKIEELKQELAVLEAERQELVDQRTAKQQERDSKQAELDQLREDAEEMDPVPQSVKDQIKQLEDEIAQLDDEIDDLDQQIAVKDQQIKQKKKEIEQYEEALEKADDEIGKLP